MARASGGKPETTREEKPARPGKSTLAACYTGPARMATPLPLGKLRPGLLADLFARHVAPDPRVVVGPRVGEDAAVLDMGDRYLVATTDPITFATEDLGC